MKKPLRSRVRRLAAIASVFVVVLTLGNVNSALANTSGSITASINSSDPELIQCPNSAGTGMTMCLFTSQDMGNQSVPYGPEKNYYPMNQTMLWRLNDGADASKSANWGFVGAVLTESDLANHIGLVHNDAFHLWAPGVRYWTPTGDVAKYFVYVPDVVDRNDESHSSRIFLFTSTDKSGANCSRFSCSYVYIGMVGTDPAQVNGGYASDPNLFIDSGNVPYLVYANGDASNCGGLSMGRVDFAGIGFIGTPQQITINNWGTDIVQNGNCAGLGHPYMEGPALYLSSAIGAPSTAPKYTMIFAAKPKDGTIPASCASSGSDKEVIAYATSNTVTGTYSYQGIIMCGSTTEWTNQASVVKHTANNGKYLFAWHDGGDAAHNRRTHLMCLRWNTSTGKAIQITRSASNLSNCA
jgi:hypothetical protein